MANGNQYASFAVDKPRLENTALLIAQMGRFNSASEFKITAPPLKSREPAGIIYPMAGIEAESVTWLDCQSGKSCEFLGLHTTGRCHEQAQRAKN